MIKRYQIGDQPKQGFVVKDIRYGGMGIIYILEMRFTETPRGGELKCAMKSCDAERIMGDEGMERIQQENLVWLSLTPHPNIVKALSFEIDGCLPRGLPVSEKRMPTALGSVRGHMAGERRHDRLAVRRVLQSAVVRGQARSLQRVLGH